MTSSSAWVLLLLLCVPTLLHSFLLQHALRPKAGGVLSRVQSRGGINSRLWASNVETSEPRPEGPDWKEIAEDLFLLFDRTLDTVEDVGVHLRRYVEKDLQKRFKHNLTKKGSRQRILVLGTGWAGHAIAKIIDTEQSEVVVVSPTNYFIFTPMLAGSAVGSIEVRSITEPIRKANPEVDYYEASCDEIFPHNKTVRITATMLTEDGEKESFMVPYDKLVYAVGAQTSTFGIPGVKENCYFLKEIADALRLRKALVDSFERANLPSVSEEDKKRILSFVVVGGGPTGVEFAGEFHDFLTRDLKKYYPRLVDLVSFKIIQSAPSILPVFDRTLQEQGLAALQAEGIEVLLNERVVEVTNRNIKLQSGSEIPYGLCVWAAGTGSRPLTKDLISKIPEQVESKAGKRGRLEVDPWLRVKGTNGTIIALGDCAEVESYPLPATGQVAAQEGAYVARLLNRGYDLSLPRPRFPYDAVDVLGKVANALRLRFREEAEPFHFLNLGLLAYIGQQQALAQVQTGDALKLIQTGGKPGLLLWRSVYLVKQVSTRNRVLVLVDWIKSRLFGRDISRL